MHKKLITLIIVVVFTLNATGQGYALRPLSEVNSKASSAGSVLDLSALEHRIQSGYVQSHSGIRYDNMGLEPKITMEDDVRASASLALEAKSLSAGLARSEQGEGRTIDRIISAQEKRLKALAKAVPKSQDYDEKDKFLQKSKLHATAHINSREEVNIISRLTRHIISYNTTGIAYTPQRLLKMMDSSNYRVYSAWLDDIYGTFGIAAIAVLHRLRNKSNWEIELFCVTCPAANISPDDALTTNTTLDAALLDYIIESLREEGALQIYGKYKPIIIGQGKDTQNSKAARLFKRAGFTNIATKGPGQRYLLRLDQKQRPMQETFVKLKVLDMSQDSHAKKHRKLKTTQVKAATIENVTLRQLIVEGWEPISDSVKEQSDYDEKVTRVHTVLFKGYPYSAWFEPCIAGLSVKMQKIIKDFRQENSWSADCETSYESCRNEEQVLAWIEKIILLMNRGNDADDRVGLAIIDKSCNELLLPYESEKQRHIVVRAIQRLAEKEDESIRLVISEVAGSMKLNLYFEVLPEIRKRCGLALMPGRRTKKRKGRNTLKDGPAAKSSSPGKRKDFHKEIDSIMAQRTFAEGELSASIEELFEAQRKLSVEYGKPKKSFSHKTFTRLAFDAYYAKLKLLKEMGVLEGLIYYPYIGGDYMPSIFAPLYPVDPTGLKPESVKMHLKTVLPPDHPFIKEPFNVVCAPEEGIRPFCQHELGEYHPLEKARPVFENVHAILLKNAWAEKCHMCRRERIPPRVLRKEFRDNTLNPFIDLLPVGAFIIVMEVHRNFFADCNRMIKRRGDCIDFLEEALPAEDLGRFKKAERLWGQMESDYKFGRELCHWIKGRKSKDSDGSKRFYVNGHLAVYQKVGKGPDGRPLPFVGNDLRDMRGSKNAIQTSA